MKEDSCTKCGRCCSNILPMTDIEIESIKKYIREHGIKEQKPNCLNYPECGIGIKNLVCPFLDESKTLKCTIYEKRPMICRFFSCKREPDIPIFNARIRNVRETFFGK